MIDRLKPGGLSKVLSTEEHDTPEFRWIGLKKLTWQDPSGTRRQWECASRTTRKAECDGVAVVAFIRYPVSLEDDEVVLISQFRPPVNAEIVEAPAGLVDEGEDAAVAAKRELLEETGYTGEVTCVSPIVPCDPGMTDANMRYVTMDVDGDAAANLEPKARPEEGEFITVRKMPARKLKEELDNLDHRGYQIDARLYAMALGYVQGYAEGREHEFKRNGLLRSTGATALLCLASIGLGYFAFGALKQGCRTRSSSAIRY